jgi:cytochrome c-type biogenesis protein CcmH
MKMKILAFFIILNFSLVNAETIKAEHDQIFKNIRCLICQGQSIADSNSEFAQTIKLIVRSKINEGESEKEIYNFLIEKYGEWIVYNPPFNKINFLLWALPYVVFLLGGLFIFSIVRKNKQN